MWHGARSLRSLSHAMRLMYLHRFDLSMLSPRESGEWAVHQREGWGCVFAQWSARVCAAKVPQSYCLCFTIRTRPRTAPVPLSGCTCPPLFECGLFRLEVPRPPIFSATKNSEANECPAAFRKGEKHNERKRLVALSSLLHALTLLYHSTKFFLFHSPCL